MNKFMLIGNLTRDIELFASSNGKPYTIIDLACQAGAKKVEYLRVKVWDKSAENCVNFLKKGSKISASGTINVYEKTIGETKVREYQLNATEIEFLSSSKNDTPNSDTPDTSAIDQIEQEIDF